MKYLVIFLFGFLFATDVYIPQNAKYYKKFFKNKNFKIHFYKNMNNINIKNAVAIVPYCFLPNILKNNYKILAPLEIEKEYIISHKSLDEIKSVANPTFEAKIFFSVLDKNVSFKKTVFEDFLKKRVDAIVLNEKIAGFYKYNLKKFGLKFNKFYLISSDKFINSHLNLVDNLIENFEESEYFKPKIVYKSFLVSSLYLNQKINFNKILYKNYLDDQYIGNKLKVILTPNWPPFNFIENRELKGIGVDFWRLLAEKANLHYEFVLENYWPDVLNAIKEKKADLTIDTSKTEDRKKYAIFTKPYMKFPLAIVCRKDIKEDDIYKLKIGVGKDYTAEKLMKKHYPKIKLIEKENVVKALTDVEDNKIDCVVDSLPVLVYLVNKNNFLNVKLYKKLPIEFKLQIMLRKDLERLRNKLNDEIDKITPEEKNAIIAKYIGLADESRINNEKHTSFNIILFVLIIFILILVYKYFKTKKMADYDKLTQVYNRNILSRELKKLLGHRGSIIYFDIDHFKEINDIYGHEKGDFVLKELAKLVKSNIRKGDVFGRWGGEEFLILLPNTPYEEALKVAEKLRKIIEQHNFGGLKVTVSFGVTSVKKGDNEESILERVDGALYESKNNGRNQVKGKK